mmetsp:Transcript_8171/g.20214  ORF Transcript_8171/g.20214 Transcript_8171/m.20214 type:complete len:255 (-) Transcript_8171:449-1213(-)
MPVMLLLVLLLCKRVWLLLKVQGQRLHARMCHVDIMHNITMTSTHMSVGDVVIAVKPNAGEAAGGGQGRYGRGCRENFLCVTPASLSTRTRGFHPRFCCEGRQGVQPCTAGCFLGGAWVFEGVVGPGMVHRRCLWMALLQLLHLASGHSNDRLCVQQSMGQRRLLLLLLLLDCGTSRDGLVEHVHESVARGGRLGSRLAQATHKHERGCRGPGIARRCAATHAVTVRRYAAGAVAVRSTKPYCKVEGGARAHGG